MWPLVRQPNLAAAQLLDAMEADQAIIPAMQAVTAAARQYYSADSDGPRRELVQALHALTGVLQPVAAQALCGRWLTQYFAEAPQ